MMKKNKSIKWICFVIGIPLLVCLAFGALNVYVDPYFHYHEPVKGLGYIMDDQRYQNNGIVRNFRYEAMITGSSMTECFRPSVLTQLTGMKSVKVPYSGGSFKEVGDNVRVACEANPNLKLVVRGIDGNRLFDDKDGVDYTDYPEFLYDDKIINDVNYVLSMEVLFKSLQNLLGFDANGALTMDFDLYSNWNYQRAYGLDAVLWHYDRNSIVVSEEQIELTEEDKQNIKENLEQNVFSIATDYPDTEFVIFMTPYSILAMDQYKLTGMLIRQIEAEKYATELALQYDNIRVFSFYNQYDIVSDLNNYTDLAHYGQDVCDMILYWISEGTGELTYDNYLSYYEEITEFYMNYDYDAIFAR